MNPLVSVIIPVYNVKPYLREALDSVIEQTYKKLDIIIIDDGSTDGSGDICDEYTSDSRVTVLHQKNGGLSNARNVGLDRAKGDYVCFLDSDDAYNKAFVEVMLNRTQETHAEIVLCKYAVKKTLEKLDTNRRDYKPSLPWLAPGTYSREDALISLIERELNVSVWNKLYKGELWRNVRFPEGHNYEDIDTMYRVVDSCQTISMVDEVLYFYRDRFGSISNSYSEKNIKDCILSRSHFETFVLSLYPRIINDTLIERFRQRNLNAYMLLFARCFGERGFRDELRKTIIEKGKEVTQWNVGTRGAYLMVCYAPSLFRCAYKIYWPCRLFVWKVTGR